MQVKGKVDIFTKKISIKDKITNLFSTNCLVILNLNKKYIYIQELEKKDFGSSRFQIAQFVS